MVFKGPSFLGCQFKRAPSNGGQGTSQAASATAPSKAVQYYMHGCPSHFMKLCFDSGKTSC